MKNTKNKFIIVEILFSHAENSTSMIDFFAFIDGFVSASRSVTFVLQKEMKNVKGFDDWYASYQFSMKSDPLFLYFNELRTVVIHEKSSIHTGKLIMPPDKNYKKSEKYIIPIVTTKKYVDKIEIDSELRKKRQENLVCKPKFIYVLEENHEIEFLDLCYAYKIKLKKIITECALKFFNINNINKL